RCVRASRSNGGRGPRAPREAARRPSPRIRRPTRGARGARAKRSVYPRSGANPSMPYRSLCRWAAALAGAMAALTLHAQTTPIDLILRGGTVFDGTGAPGYTADVAISRGFIARIGDLTSLTAPVELDVTGLYVAPGFINIHSHARPDGLPRAENMLTQGVTTEIINADGGG